MPLKTEIYNGVCVISALNDLSGEEPAAVRKTVEKHIQDHHIVSYIVDLEHCPFVDSQGWETLLWLKTESEKLFGMTRLTGLDDTLRKILEITRLSNRFQTNVDVSQALKTMR